MILQTRRKAAFLSIALSLAAVLPRPSQAAEPASLIGSWKLTANYDQFTDGRRRDTWGDTPQGLLVVTANGLFAVQIMGVNRQPRPGAVPTESVGPAIAYYGRYSVDEGNKGFSVRVEQSTFPQWIGTLNVRTIEELSSTTLRVVAAPIKDPQGGEFQPHLEFERIP